MPSDAKKKREQKKKEAAKAKQSGKKGDTKEEVSNNGDSYWNNKYFMYCVNNAVLKMIAVIPSLIKLGMVVFSRVQSHSTLCVGKILIRGLAYFHKRKFSFTIEPGNCCNICLLYTKQHTGISSLEMFKPNDQGAKTKRVKGKWTGSL